MIKILTENGMKYTIDVKNKILIGGDFPEGIKYKSASILVGEEAKFILEDGEEIVTSKVLEYL